MGIPVLHLERRNALVILATTEISGLQLPSHSLMTLSMGNMELGVSVALLFTEF